MCGIIKVIFAAVAVFVAVSAIQVSAGNRGLIALSDMALESLAHTSFRPNPDLDDKCEKVGLHLRSLVDRSAAAKYPLADIVVDVIRDLDEKHHLTFEGGNSLEMGTMLRICLSRMSIWKYPPSMEEDLDFDAEKSKFALGNQALESLDIAIKEASSTDIDGKCDEVGHHLRVLLNNEPGSMTDLAGKVVENLVYRPNQKLVHGDLRAMIEFLQKCFKTWKMSTVNVRLDADGSSPQVIITDLGLYLLGKSQVYNKFQPAETQCRALDSLVESMVEEVEGVNITKGELYNIIIQTLNKKQAAILPYSDPTTLLKAVEACA